MKHKVWLLIIVLTASFLLFMDRDVRRPIQSFGAVIEQRVENVAVAIEAQPVAADQQNDPAADSSGDETESSAQVTGNSLQGQQLSDRIYYYHFAKNTPPSVKRVFKAAVKTYNQTGLVRLVAGAGEQRQNQIAFSTYRKVMTPAQTNTIELGVGGPGVTQQVGWDSYTANHGTASLNVQYGESIRTSVAIHELGHALGLTHNEKTKNSVMYPLDQGKTNLTRADLAGLKAIYQGTAKAG